MKTSIVLLSLVVAAIYVIGNNAQTKAPSSFSRCTCIIAPKLKIAKDVACKEQKTFDTIRECILKNCTVSDGKEDTKPDIAVAKKIVDEFEASAGQKESIKKSLDTCDAQTKNRSEDNRSCVYEILMRRCASAPCPPKN